VSDDLERRLRDSLRAYAELVDAPDSAVPSARATPKAPLRRWRGAVLAAAAAAVVVTGSVWFVDVKGADNSASSAASDMAATAGGPQSDTGAAAEAKSASASLEVGVAYPFDLYTHCGVRGADLGGVWFAVGPPLVEGAGNPPSGWGNPYQHGTVTLLTADRAVFRDDAGHEVVLRADGSARPEPCD
jgi:hypothetical protein